MPRSPTSADDELAQLERLIEVPDPDLYAALTGDSRAGAGIRTPPCSTASKSFRAWITTHEGADTIAGRIARARPRAHLRQCRGGRRRPGRLGSRARGGGAAKPPAVSLAVVCRDGPRMQQLARALEFFAPDLPVLQFPAWDCQPYDRVSPHGGILAQRLTTLARLSRLTGSEKPQIVLTTVNAIVQRVPAREIIAAQALSVAPGHVVPMDSIVAWLEHNGYNRSSTVREPGEYAVRGGILDLFPAGLDQPVRFDFFGDSLELIRSFDAETQRTLLPCARSTWFRSRNSSWSPRPSAASGWAMSRPSAPPSATIRSMKPSAKAAAIPAWSIGCRCSRSGWTRCSIISATRRSRSSRKARTPPASVSSRSQDYYEARREALEHPGGGAVYKPLPPDRLYLTEDEWSKRLEEASLARLTPFAVPEGSAGVIDASARQGRNFTPERADAKVNVFEVRGRACAGIAGAAQEGGDRAVERRLARPHGQHAEGPQAAQPHQRQQLAHGAGDAAQRGDAGGGRHGIRLRDRRCRRHQRAGHSGRPAGAAAQGHPQARQFHLRGDESRHRRSGGPCRARHRPLRRPADARGRRRAA